MSYDEYMPYLLRRFEWISKVYDLISCSLTDQLRVLPVRLSGVKKDSTVLDVCTGTGNLAIEFSKYAKEVTAVDISPDMLKVARAKKSRVRFMLMDATKLIFNDKSFDICCISTALHEMPIEVRREVLKEINRVTKDKVVVIEYCLPRNAALRYLLVRILCFFYESRYLLEFIKTDLKELLLSSGLKIVKEKRVIGIFKIYICLAS